LYEENKVAVVTFFFFFNPFQCEVYLDNWEFSWLIENTMPITKTSS
jgi:hypothetical protein